MRRFSDTVVKTGPKARREPRTARLGTFGEGRTMSLRTPSLAEFSRQFSRVSESLLSGGSLDQSGDLIRQQLEARGVAIRIAERHHGPAALHIADEAGPAPNRPPEERLQRLQAVYPVRTNASSVDAEGIRYDLYVFRSDEDHAFTDAEETLCEIFVAQLRRGLEMSAQLSDTEAERTVYSDVMDRLSVGVVLIDAGGRILKSSPIADRTMLARDGLVAQGGRLRATGSVDDRTLQAAIRAAADAALAGLPPSPRGVTLSRVQSDRGLGVVVQSLGRDPRAWTGRPLRIAVYTRDPDTTAEIEGELVRQLFDLTPAEAAVARRLASGLSLEDAATSLSISRNTARAHLRSIFSKSGITRQTELVRLMLSSAAVLGHVNRRVA
jgi:DNA-binding CsgD family transcriptional regulator